MSLDRLRSLQAENTARAFEMSAERGRFAALASRHEDGTAPRAVSSFNLFQTPEHIAERMAAMIPTSAKRILEPSAGLGRLYKPLASRCTSAEFVLVDSSRDCLAELYRITEGRPGVSLKAGDFLNMNELGKFDAVVMNPPFKQGADVRHIMHALDMLEPGGLLVSLCYDGARQAAKLKPIATTWEQLPEHSFKQEGTRAAVVLLTIRKGKDAVEKPVPASSN